MPVIRGVRLFAHLGQYDRLHTRPAWLASAPRGRGFAEVAEKVLAARQR